MNLLNFFTNLLCFLYFSAKTIVMKFKSCLSIIVTGYSILHKSLLLYRRLRFGNYKNIKNSSLIIYYL